MQSTRNLILKLHLQGQRNVDIWNRLKPLKINKRFIERTLQRYKNTGTVDCKKKPGKKRSVRTSGTIKIIRERIRRNPATSARKLARNLNIPKTTVLRVLHEDLKLKAYKKQKVHGLSAAQKLARVKKSKELLAWHAGDEVLFSDEKLFLLQETHNQQNNRIWSVTLADIPRDKLAVSRFQNVSRVMVWGGISKTGKLPLLFIESGVKINQSYYIEHVLERHVLAHVKEMYGDDYFIFQQDSAPSHKAKNTQKWLAANFPDFWTPDDWPASSPDLNPLDFCIWGYMLSKINNTKNVSLDQFKVMLVKIWDDIPQDVVRAACLSFDKRLRAVIKEKGERFELKK
jgi:transposase